MKADYVKHILEFKKDAATSRGKLKTHTAFFIRFQNGTNVGIGEASPLQGLSIDYRDDFESHVKDFCRHLNEGKSIENFDLDELPSLRFAVETAQLGLNNGDPFHISDSKFFTGKGIPINGLVWMDDADKMYEEARSKIAEGYTCIKFKIGALDFDEECRLIERIRKEYNAFKLEIRLDANGAFANHEALEKINELSRFGIHSLEQPVKAGNTEVMKEICALSKINIALDEELIGIKPGFAKGMLEFIRPHYIIVKPTLLGGLSSAQRWTTIANQLNIGWWATSALESNIGLNAIAQWTSQFNSHICHGLGTGSLYKNNIPSPLQISTGELNYNKNLTWELVPFNILAHE